MRTVMTVAMGVSMLLSAATRAQQGCTWLSVDGATATAVGVLWSHGYDDDARGQCGMARVLTECRLQRARNAVPDLLASGMSVGHDYSMVFAVVGRSDVERIRTVVSALLDDALPLDDDLLRLTVARVALAADDAEFLYPGSVLEMQARAALADGSAQDRPVAGRADELAGLTPAAVRAALLRAVPTRAACLGHVDNDLVEALRALEGLRPGQEPRTPIVVTARGAGPDHMSGEQHARCDAPFVLAAMPAPPPQQRAAFALAIEIAKARLQKSCRLYGSEIHARAPLVAWSWLHADPFVRFYRRGENPESLLPGQEREADGTQESQATQRELAQAMTKLASAPTEKELRLARRVLAAEMALPVPGQAEPCATEPSLLPGKLMLLLLSTHHGIAVSALDAVTAEQVHAQLRSFDPALASWHALVPVPRSDHGFRLR